MVWRRLLFVLYTRTCTEVDRGVSDQSRHGKGTISSPLTPSLPTFRYGTTPVFPTLGSTGLRHLYPSSKTLNVLVSRERRGSSLPPLGE